MEYAYTKTAQETESLGRYCASIAHLTPLSSEREIELAKRIKSGDKEALQELVSANLKFVVQHAYKYYSGHPLLLDIIMEGNAGLMEAATRFDPEKGVRFITYAVYWVRQSIQLALLEKLSLIKVPCRNMQKIKDLRKLKRGMKPGEEQIYLGTKRALKMHISLDTTICGDDIPMVETLPDNSQMSEEANQNILSSELPSVINKIVNKLNGREKDIIIKRYGLNREKPETLRVIGKNMGLSQERVRQLELRALAKLLKLATINRLVV